MHLITSVVPVADSQLLNVAGDMISGAAVDIPICVDAVTSGG
jgi:hypothetical protein